jgi:hypothetical protein
MPVDQRNNDKLLWAEIDENRAENINGGICRSRSRMGQINSFIQNTVLVFQTNIVTITGNIGGDLTINLGNASDINQVTRGRGRGRG